MGFSIICFPHAGGGAAMFRGWESHLPADFRVCPIDLPGREGRILEPAFTRLEPVVEALADEVGPLMRGGALFFGHSMGALIAFELARMLRARGDPLPRYLVVAGCPPPDGQHRRNLHRLPRSLLLRELRSLGGTPPELLEHEELMELVLPTLRADLELCETYRYTPDAPLDCPLSVFGGMNDRTVTADELAGWARHTTAQFTLRLLPGNHFFLTDQRAALLRALTDDCAAAHTARMSA